MMAQPARRGTGTTWLPRHSLVAVAPGLRPGAERGAAVGGGQAASLPGGRRGAAGKGMSLPAEAHDGMAWHGTACQAMR